jgi:hypothetical protein
VGLQQPSEVWPGVPQENQREENAKQTPGKGKERFCIIFTVTIITLMLCVVRIQRTKARNQQQQNYKTTRKHLATWRKIFID